MAKVLVGMSGGVDSAVAAYLLKREGHEVIGITLRTWEAPDGGESRCCEIDDARAVAHKLDIPYYPINCISEFESHVTRPFIRDYIKGLTPNPCIECNRYVKWERMLYQARVMKADFIATGHYASVVKKENGRYTVKKAGHAEKDQTYMLYKLTQEQLGVTLMPLGNLKKDEVRKLAADAGLPVADKADSQEICFVPDDDHAGYIMRNAEEEVPGEGLFLDEEGNPLGKHKGIIRYTVGQRRGLELALGYPAYVKEIRPEDNAIIIGRESSLYTDTVLCRDVNFLSIPEPAAGDKLRCFVKIRYHHKPQAAYIEAMQGGKIRAVFDEPVKAAAPGQSAVFYDDDDCVIGGGIITKE